jgi:hypothetical protein
MTPIIRQYILDFWTDKQKEEDALQQRALALYLEAAASPVNATQQRKRQQQDDQGEGNEDEQRVVSKQDCRQEQSSASECEEVQAIVLQK